MQEIVILHQVRNDLGALVLFVIFKRNTAARVQAHAESKKSSQMLRAFRKLKAVLSSEVSLIGSGRLLTTISPGRRTESSPATRPQLLSRRHSLCSPARLNLNGSATGASPAARLYWDAEATEMKKLQLHPSSLPGFTLCHRRRFCSS